jgi:ABC-type antimicrobial peptide transport system permease subunit
LRRRLQSLPGVRALAIIPGSAPLLDDNSTDGYWIEGRERPGPGQGASSYQYCGTPGFLAAMDGGVSAFDPLAYGSLTLVLVLVALTASWLPARRAARVAPKQALRAD